MTELSIREDLWPTTMKAFDRLLADHVPVVFRGLAQDWIPARPAASEMLPWLSSVIGHRDVKTTLLLRSDHGLLGAGGIKNRQRVNESFTGKRPFRRIADELQAIDSEISGTALYIQSVPIASDLPELVPFIRLPIASFAAEHHGEWRAWIGTGRHHTALHWDAQENFFCVLAGEKIFHVCRHEMLPNAYFGAIEGNEYGAASSVVDPMCPDFEQYPLFERVVQSSTQIALQPGDVLYLPCNWLHWVESNGFNVSVNYWMKDVPDLDSAQARGTFLRALLWLRRLPPHWQAYWKTMFEEYVFRVNGDPYAHLPVDEQGFAGHQTAVAIDRLETLIASADAVLLTSSTSQDAVMVRRYRLSGTVMMRCLSAGRVAIRDVATGREVDVPATLVPVLTEFHSPSIPAEIIEKLGATDGIARDEVVRALCGLVRSGLLTAAPVV